MVQEGMKVIRVRHERNCEQASAPAPTCSCYREDVILNEGERFCRSCLRPTTAIDLCGPCEYGGPIGAVII